MRIWDAGTGAPIGEPLTGHTNNWVRGVAVGRVCDRDIIASGGDDTTVRIWDAGTGAPIGEPLTGHTSLVTGVAVGRVGGRDIIASGGVDGTVRIWDPTSGRCEIVLDLLGGATACALGAPGLLCTAVGSAVCAFTNEAAQAALAQAAAVVSDSFDVNLTDAYLSGRRGDWSAAPVTSITPPTRAPLHTRGRSASTVRSWAPVFIGTVAFAFIVVIYLLIRSLR